MAKATKAVGLDEDQKWRARNDASTLKEAEEIKGDKGRLERATKHAADEAESMQKVADLRKRGLISGNAAKKMGADKDGDAD